MQQFYRFAPRMTLLNGCDVIELGQYYSQNQQRSDVSILEVRPTSYPAPRLFTSTTSSCGSSSNSSKTAYTGCSSQGTSVWPNKTR